MTFECLHDEDLYAETQHYDSVTIAYYKIIHNTMQCNTCYTKIIQGGAKTGPPAILSHCKYSENSMTELHGNWWTSAILYAEHSH